MDKQPLSLVTGGAGFIGSHLCDALIDLGHRVIAVDSLITGKKDNLKKALQQPSFSFRQLDVTSATLDEPVNYIFHLASPASVIDYQKYPEETALVNSVGTRNLLRLAKKYRAKFLFASTSEIYGDPLEHPQKESYWGHVNPIGIRACYDESKRFGEMITMLYFRNYLTDARIVRIFNTYGPRMKEDDGRVVSNFINQAIAGGPITVYGEGKQTRSFCYVSDMVEGIIKAMLVQPTAGEVINLGNPEEWRMIDLAQKIKDMTHSKAQIVFKPLPADDPRERRPDITKAHQLLNWQPQVALTDGLTQTISYYTSLQR